MLNIQKNMERLGTESAFEVLSRAQKLNQEGKDIINLGIGQPDFKTPCHIVECGIKALKDGHHGYTAATGIPELREAVAFDLKKRHGADVDPNDVVIVPGGKPTMFFSILMFGGLNSEIIYPDPGFPIYSSLINFTGSKAVPVPIKEKNNFSFNAEDILEKITPKTRLIIINSPANPTGGVTSKVELEKFVRGVVSFPKIAVLSDEIYSHMVYGELEHTSLLKYPEIRNQLIMLDGWSKTYAMTGWRIGYAAGPKDIIKAIGKIQSQSTSNPSSISQAAAVEALNGTQNFIQERSNAFKKRRDFVVNSLNKINGIECLNPNGAFYVFPSCKGLLNKKTKLKTDSDFVQRLLEKANVAVVQGSAFGLDGYFRISYATSMENLKKAMDRIKFFCESLN